MGIFEPEFMAVAAAIQGSDRCPAHFPAGPALGTKKKKKKKKSDYVDIAH